MKGFLQSSLILSIWGEENNKCQNDIKIIFFNGDGRIRSVSTSKRHENGSLVAFWHQKDVYC